MSLIEQLLNRQNQVPLWVTANDNPMDSASLFARIRLFQAVLANRRLVLQPKDDIDFIEMFCALDGIAKEVLVLQPDMALTESDILIREFAPEQVINNLGDVAILPSTPGHFNDVATRWLLPTSGTTGTAKIISHDHYSLTRSIARGKPDLVPCWGLMYEATRFAGLQVVLQSLLGSGTLLIPENRHNLNETVRFFSQSGCNSLSATPTLWRKLLMTPALKELSLHRITLGGEIADQMVLDALHSRFPAARITHIYASTETGVGFSVTDGKAGFPLTWVENGHTPNGVGIKIDDGSLKLSFPWQPNNDKENNGQLGSREIPFIDTGDAVCIKDDRVLFQGRTNGAINVGGNKVMPEEVEAVLNNHPQVHLVRVIGHKNPFTGMIVTAEVVLKSDVSEPSEMDLIAFCREKLEPWKVPARIRILSDLDVAGSGKIRRRSS